MDGSVLAVLAAYQKHRPAMRAEPTKRWFVPKRKASEPCVTATSITFKHLKQQVAVKVCNCN